MKINSFIDAVIASLFTDSTPSPSLNTKDRNSNRRSTKRRRIFPRAFSLFATPPRAGDCVPGFTRKLRSAAHPALCSALLVAASFFAASPDATAKDVTWAGTPGNAWNTTDQNWVLGAYFVTGDNVTFDGTAIDKNVVVDMLGVTAGGMTVNSGSNYTFSGGAIGGGFELTKQGGGTLTLSSANSYTDGTNLSQGRIDVGNDAALGTGALSMAAWTTLGFSVNGLSVANDISIAGNNTIDTDTYNATLGGIISGAGNFFKTGGGTLRLSGVNTYNGGTNLQVGRIDVGNNSALGNGILYMSTGTTLGFSAGDLSVGNAITITNAAVTVDTGTNNATLSGIIAGTNGSLTKTGNGTLTLSGVNSYTGDTTIAAGGLTIEGTLGNGNYTGAISNDGSLTFNQNTAQTLSGVISGDGSLTKTGTGTLTLSGANSYTGGTNLNVGRIDVGHGSALGTGTLCDGNYTGAISNDGSLTFDQTAVQTLSGVISGGGSLTKTGNGTLTLSGVNTYGGGTAISAGGLTVTGRLGNGNYTGAISNDGSLTFNQNTAQTLSGVISGDGSFTKTGVGTLTLSGVNTYTGNTAISAGGLTVTGRLGNGNYTGAISNDGSLTFDQTAVQTLSGTITGSGTLTKSGSGTLTLGSELHVNDERKILVDEVRKEGSVDFAVLESGGTMTGSFDSLTGFKSKFFDASHGITGNQYLISVAYNDQTKFTDYSWNHNSNEIARNLDASMDDDAMQDLINGIIGDDARILAGLDTLRGTELHADAGRNCFLATSRKTRALCGHV